MNFEPTENWPQTVTFRSREMNIEEIKRRLKEFSDVSYQQTPTLKELEKYQDAAAHAVCMLVNLQMYAEDMMFRLHAKD